ncbi:DUF6266 family protein [Parapedobacter koreensis]|uniref:Uncharacterized protein n=1 Tax=Parapedobacter koreensis TaxID=332977 RepID=A0A1H7U9H6_9SPHI|nr:DUF6266 family protein [Parapedobacter koreensis]SEL93394.1 hypothetical protein SAMN05421740_11436 [Parapedobacter koreensis]
MATYNQGLNGSFSGKAGSVVGANWRSIGYIRGLSRFKNKSNSPRQAAQRLRFGMAVSFMRPMKSILRIGFMDRVRSRNTGFNQGIRQFINHAIVGEYPDFGIDYAQVAISNGGMEKLMGLTLASDQPYQLTLGWVDRTPPPNPLLPDPGVHNDDRVFVLLYNRTEDVYTTNTSAFRQDEGLALELPAVFAGHELHVWVFAQHRDGTDVSASQYVGSVTLAGDGSEPEPEPDGEEEPEGTETEP